MAIYHRRRPADELRSEEHTLNSSHTEIYTLSLHDALPIYGGQVKNLFDAFYWAIVTVATVGYGDISPQTTGGRIEIGRAHSELQSHRDLHSFPTRRSSDLWRPG